MKILKCLAVDDEHSALRTLESYVLQTDGLSYIGGVQSFDLAWGLLSDDRALPDILFLDLQGVKGEQLAERVKDKKIMIVFTTGYTDFAVESYRYGTIDYLLKPFSYERFLEAVDKCRRYDQLLKREPIDEEDTISIKDSNSNKLIIVPKDKIRYIEAWGNYCKVFVEVEGIKYLMPLISLAKMYQSLNPEKFLRIHRGWVVHLSQIKAYDGETVTLKDDMTIKLGRAYKRAFRKWIEDKL